MTSREYLSQQPDLHLIDGGLSDAIVQSEPRPVVVSMAENNLADIVSLDAQGRGHVSDSYNPSHTKEDHSRNGQFLTKYEMEQIAAHEGQIRRGAGEREAENAAKRATEAAEVAKRAFEDVKAKAAKRAAGGGPRGPKGPGSLERFSDEDTAAATLRKNILHGIDPELAQDLATALNDYTILAAELQRSTITGGRVSLAPTYKYRMENGEYVVDNAGNRVMEQVTLRASKKNVEEARQRYEAVRLRAKEWEIGMMKDAELNLPPEDRVMISKLEDQTEARMIALGIKFEAEALAEPKGFMAGSRRKFYDWWARQGGGDGRRRLLGTTKKAAVMVAVGLPIGVAAGAAGVFLAGPLVGGVLAGGVARGVSRGLMRGRIEKNATARSVAAAQYAQRLAVQHANIENNHIVDDDGETQYPQSITDVYAESTAKDVQRNRVRTAASVAIGAVAGLSGAYLGELVHNAIWGGEHHPATPPSTGTTHEPGSTTPVQPQPGHTPQVPNQPPHISPPLDHGVTGEDFTVEHGSGEIREIQEYASLHNYNVTPEQAYRIYTDLYAEHGAKIIDLKGPGPDTYVIHPGDVGLRHSGIANWYPGIEDELRDRLAEASDEAA